MGMLATEYALAARRALLKTASEDPLVIAARKDPNDFCEYVFRDDQTGGPIIQAPHQRKWQSMVWLHDRLIMWYPLEHGKTTQAKMTLCRLLGEHGDRQYGFVSSKGTQGMKMVGAVKREIESNPRLHRVYPNLKPQIAALHSGLEQWGNEGIRVADCPRGSKDPSLAPFGLNGKILGARLHGVIIDNGLDADNTNSAALRLKTMERIKDEIIGRVMKGGFIWILDTAWFHDDYMHVFAGEGSWTSLKLDAMKPMREGDETLWPAQFSRERLDARRAELGPTAFDRQFRNRPLSESMKFFKQEFWDAAYGRVPWLDNLLGEPPGINKQCEVRTGIDLATRKGEIHDLTAMATIMEHGHRRRLIHLKASRMVATEILRAMVPIYRNIHRPVNLAGGNAKFVVEDNAAQVYIVDLLKDAGILKAIGLTQNEASDIRVTGRTTTSKKRDQELGIPAIASGFEMGRWDVAAHDETKALWDEMRVWSPGADHYGDRLMAVWFATADMMATGAGFTVDYI